MKPILFFIFLISFFIGHSQPKIESATQQSWSSGACCSVGSNYRVIISGSYDVINNIEIEAVIYDGREFGNVSVVKSIQPKDSTSYMFLEFSYSYTMRGIEYPIDNIIVNPKKLVDGIYYKLHHVNARLQFSEMRELPPIPYP